MKTISIEYNPQTHKFTARCGDATATAGSLDTAVGKLVLNNEKLMGITANLKGGKMSR